MIACTPASNRAVLLLVVEEERTVRKPADKVIAPILLDNPVLSHVDVIPKTRLLYQFYCINKPLYSLSRCRVEMSSIRQTYGLTASASSSNLLSQIPTAYGIDLPCSTLTTHSHFWFHLYILLLRLQIHIVWRRIEIYRPCLCYTPNIPLTIYFPIMSLN